jgi:hypothetical protein
MEERGPFDRILQPEPARAPDRTALFVVALAVVLGIILLVLVLPPVSIFSGSGTSAKVSGPISAKARDQSPAPPSGFESVSQLFDLVSAQPVRESARLTVNLSTTASQGDTLYLYTYANNRWRRLGEATPVGDGSAARGDVPTLPDNVAVFRKASAARAVIGFLPAGAELDPQAADSLTALQIGGFSPGADGGITGSAPALPAGLSVPVAPVIGAASADQIANLNAVLASPDLRSAHAQAITNFVRDGQYAGVNLDYRAMNATSGPAFTALVTNVSSALRADGKSLTLTLPMPVRTGGTWDSHGFDWQALAPLTDTIKLATGPEQDTFYQQTRDALAYLVPLTGGSKLLLGTSSRGFERAADGVHTPTLTESLATASAVAAQPGSPLPPGATVQLSGQNLSSTTGGSALHWDDSAKAVSFSYTGAGGQHTVWLSNVFSESFKLDLARQYALAGVAIDDVSTQTADANVWPTVREYAASGQVTLSLPNGSLLQPAWQADGGTLQSTTGESVTWQAPNNAGSYTLTLVVSDGVLRVGQQLQLSVQAPGAAGGQ